jgi:hypothetical protein
MVDKNNFTIAESKQSLMKRNSLKLICSLFVVIAVLSSCYKLQKDYDYQKVTLDPHYNMTAKQYMYSRDSFIVGGKNDTILRWMIKGIQYAGIDWAEYEKPNRTYIFLHNSAIRVLTSGKVTGGFFFDYPIIPKDVNGNPIPSISFPGTDSMRPAFQWSDYSVQTVKNYFLSLIGEGQYTFENLGVANQSIQSLLPPGTVAGNDSKLSYVVVQTTPNPDPAFASLIVFDKTTGKGFDPEGKFNLKLINNQNAPINVNDRTDDRTAGILCNNGPVHVYDKTVHPFRYSWQ